MIGRVALLVTFKKAKPKSQSLSRSHIRDFCCIYKNVMKQDPLLHISFWPDKLLAKQSRKKGSRQRVYG